jgi:hypothetical protein
MQSRDESYEDVIHGRGEQPAVQAIEHAAVAWDQV